MQNVVKAHTPLGSLQPINFLLLVSVPPAVVVVTGGGGGPVGAAGHSEFSHSQPANAWTLSSRQSH